MLRDDFVPVRRKSLIRCNHQWVDKKMRDPKFIDDACKKNGWDRSRTAYVSMYRCKKCGRYKGS